MDQVEASMCEVTKLQGQEANFTKDVAANLAEIGKPGRDRGDLLCEQRVPFLSLRRCLDRGGQGAWTCA